MIKIYKLQNQIKHYDWGSVKLIPDLLGLKDNAPEKPCAEMWMGTHLSAPSYVPDSGVSLKEISGELPFLLKLIAVEKPLSIQVHPDKEQAQDGFKRENEAGIEIDSPLRNYKDQNAKNELICAITPFTLMAGFMEPKKIYASLGDTLREQWDLVKKLESLYPQDAGAFSPLFLNVITLQPGQGLFIPAGTPHAYISGFGVELMTNSDNVIRGGLTSKHIDGDELKKISKPVPFIPQIITPCGEPLTCYPLTGENFSLYHIRGDKSVSFPQSGHSVCIVTEGELKTETQTFKKGESFYVPRCGKDAPLLLEGTFSLFAACARE